MGHFMLDCWVTSYGCCRYTKMSNAMKTYGKNIFFSLCEWWVSSLEHFCPEGRRVTGPCFFNCVLSIQGKRKSCYLGRQHGQQLENNWWYRWQLGQVLLISFWCTWITTEIDTTDHSYHDISAWHLVQTRMTDGLPMLDLVDGTVRVQTRDDSVHA